MHRAELYRRLFWDPIFTEVVRAVGYQGCTYGELQARLEPLVTGHGPERVRDAIWTLLLFERKADGTVEPETPVSLGIDVALLCGGLLGPRPGTPEYEDLQRPTDWKRWFDRGKELTDKPPEATPKQRRTRQ